MMKTIFTSAVGIVFVSLTVLAGAEPAQDPQQILHVLNRVTFGPRPGDVAKVQQMGLSAYIDQQLHPETIDDSMLDKELESFALLQMSPQELVDIFRDERQNKKQKKEAAAATAPPTPEVAKPEVEPMTMAERANQWRSVAAIGQLADAKLVRAVDSQRQLQEVLVDFWTNHFNIDMKKGPCRVLKVTDDRDVIRAHIFGHFRDMLEASAKSPAMLFYLDNAENSAPRELGPVQRQMAEAFIQNNPGLPIPPLAPPGKKQGGINENYAREIMELHTLGVDGGYTQKDVQEVARCFTGWTLNRQTGEFQFTPGRHDNGEKLVLQRVIPANGGMQDGESVLDMLALHPSTAHFISRELCQRFVSDDPPEDLVGRIATVFKDTNGDLRAVVAAILASPEFLSPDSYQTKIKSPLEFAVSAIRATDSSLAPPPGPPFDKLKSAMEGAAVLGRGKAGDRIAGMSRQPLNFHVFEMGEPLFVCTPPTGYKEDSKAWVSPGALIERLNFALALTQSQVSDVRFDAKNILAPVDAARPQSVLDQSVAALLPGKVSDGTRQVLAQAALPAAGDESKTVDTPKLIALILGSPEFQRK